MGTSLAARLERDDRRPTVTAFPDGSVDRFYDVFDGGDRVRRREAFGEAVAAGTTAFTLRESAPEPGGHAVNAAVQADRLGNETTLVGHLGDPTFAALPFETISMGEPSRVAIYEFDDGDVLAVDPSADAADWSFDDLGAATGTAFESLLSADVVVCANWSTFDALPDALAELAAADLDGGYFVFDPGDLADPEPPAAGQLFDALADLTGAYDVILAANGEEVRALCAALGDVPDDAGARLDRLRKRADLAAAVRHETEAAVAATPDGRVRVENFDVEPTRNTGGGDRFDAGMSHALARDWSWEDALRLGNACASRYVATGETAGAPEIAEFLRERE